MNNVTMDFERRVIEIDLYFTFIERIINHDAKLLLKQSTNNSTQSRPKRAKISKELTKILRANAFLLLYNLTESSIRQAIEEICNTITNEQKPYVQLRDEIKKKFISENLKDFKDKGTEEIFRFISGIAIDNISLTFAKDRLAGNIDARTVRDFATTYGFSSSTHHRTGSGEKLFIVKNKRNALAHGEISFADCGKDYTIEELIVIKRGVVNYLRRILQNIETYIAQQDYLHKTS